MSWLGWLVLGMLVGGTFGLVGCSLVVTARRADKWVETHLPEDEP